jgi:hypothetical protein
VALQHELRNTSMGIPELDTAIFGSTEDPVAMWSQCDTEHEVLESCQNSHLD